MTFMDSAGLGEIVRSYKQVTGRGGRLAAVCTSRIVLRLFRVTGIDTVIDVFGSVEAATAAD
jgi:anti-anti-sigma factor